MPSARASASAGRPFRSCYHYAAFLQREYRVRVKHLEKLKRFPSYRGMLERVRLKGCFRGTPDPANILLFFVPPQATITLPAGSSHSVKCCDDSRLPISQFDLRLTLVARRCANLYRDESAYVWLISFRDWKTKNTVHQGTAQTVQPLTVALFFISC